MDAKATSQSKAELQTVPQRDGKQSSDSDGMGAIAASPSTAKLPAVPPRGQEQRSAPTGTRSKPWNRR